MNRDVLYWIWLAECFSYGSVKPMQIIQSYKTARNFYQRRQQEAKTLSFLTPRDVKKICTSKLEDCRSIIERCRKNYVKISCYGDETYPFRLREIDCPPMVFYYLGDISILQRRCVAIVGTRNASEQSRNTTFRLAGELAKQGIVVISGCAGGIDTSAHRGALEAGVTVSILGTALNENYPAFNAGLKRTIINRGGMVISEYPIGTPTNRGMFPIRNRLISGLSDAVIVAEAPKHSGSLITAHNAMDQGREVFCIPPADIFNARYDGVKDLLRECAGLVMGVEDIVQTYRKQALTTKYTSLTKKITDFSYKPVEKFEHKTVKNENVDHEIQCSENARIILKSLAQGKASMEQIAAQVDLSLPKIMTALTELEIAEFVKKEGGYYQRF